MEKPTHIALTIEQMKEVMQLLGETPAKYSHKAILIIEHDGRPVNIEAQEESVNRNIDHPEKNTIFEVKH